MGPHSGHHLGVKQNVDVVTDCAHLECADARQNVIVWVVVVLVRNELAVNLFLIPGFGDAVHDAGGVGDDGLDLGGDVGEELGVLGLVVARVPLVACALAAHLEDKGLRTRHAIIKLIY